MKDIKNNITTKILKKLVKISVNLHYNIQHIRMVIHNLLSTNFLITLDESVLNIFNHHYLLQITTQIVNYSTLN